MTEAKVSRKQQILQALMEMLEDPNIRITTAALAKRVGVSEAALYRHFASKAQMYDALIEFVEETIFSRAKKDSATRTKRTNSMSANSYPAAYLCRA